MRWRYVVGGLVLAWLLRDLYWAWWEDHQAIAVPPGSDRWGFTYERVHDTGYGVYRSVPPGKERFE